MDNAFLTCHNSIIRIGDPVSFERGGSACVSHVKPVTATAEKPKHYALGGSFDIHHAGVHLILLPHAIPFNSHIAPVAVRDLAEALPDSNWDAIQGLNDLLDLLRGP
jgi:hypothetical protein